MMIERNIKTVIVTGPTGAVGTALCSRLLQAGCTVVAVCRPGSPRAVALPKDANLYVVACDAANLADLPQCMAAAGLPVQADAFFHLAWAHTIGAGRNDMPAQIENIRYTIDAVRTAAAMGCRVFVGTGSQAEYGRVDGVLRADTPTNPENGYGMAKLCAGQMSRTEAAALGMDHVWARILSVYGPHDGPNDDLRHHPITAGRAVPGPDGRGAEVGLSLLRRCCGCTVPHGLPWPQRCRVPGGQRHRPPPAGIY